ncbi:MAG: response regulator [Limisphaerales bacterium]
MDENKSGQGASKISGIKGHDRQKAARTASLPKVLILEDEVSFANIVRQYFEAWGFSVVYVQDGVEGIKRVMRENFSIILCDMLMPNLAGDMFYKAVERVKPQLCKRFIFMTGNHNDTKITEFIREVRGIIIWKPFQMHILHEAVQAIEKKHGLDGK